MTATPDPYKILQVDSEAEDEVIQAAYRRLAQKYHPDVAATPEAAARMSAINAAWEVLRDPARRAAHDLGRRLAARDAAGRAAAAPAAGTTGQEAPPGARFTQRPSASHRSGGQANSGSGAPNRPAETVSSDRTSGRSSTGSGYDPSRMGAPDGFGAAGPPPGEPSGSVLNFGRFAGWSLGEISRHDLEYLEWLDRAPIGRIYRDEIDVILRKAGRRRSADAQDRERRGLFRRR
ncbi:MAG: J domain-containing protein [Chloroflexi bacterium]|nr:J domain-containing protein [Chloroflexota bacterium]